MIPTIADTGKFCPAEKDNDIPVVGWIGTHSTFPFLESLFPVLERLASKHNFILKIVGAGKEDVSIPGVNTTSLEWNLDREVADFQSLDIGLYPVVISDSANSEWLMGKSGFKAIQYMAVGIPFVMSPVGVCAEIGEANSTHFNAATAEDWCNSLDKLLSDGELRRQMGEKGREHSLKYYSVPVHAGTLARALEAVSIRGGRDDR